MTKTIGYTALHYGADYLAWAIRSVIAEVDQHYVLYCPHGSHGVKTDLQCPDSRTTLYDLARQAAGNKLVWIDGDWNYENEQRESILQYAADADIILIVDADEIWGENVVWSAKAQYSEAQHIHCQRWRAPVMEYWRSFYRAETHNLVYPVRVIYPHVDNAWDKEHGEGYLNRYNVGHEIISHMGYAQRSEVVYYKQHTHGHRGDWRPNWYEEKFAANVADDCHPTNKDYWNPTLVDPLEFMPSFMAEHPYFNLEVIP